MHTATIYVRNSKAIGAANVSQAKMVSDCQAFADSHGLYVGDRVHIDNGKSGSIRDRPEFVKWLQDGRAGHVMITWHSDRLTREGVNAAGMVLDVIEGKDPVTGAVTGNPVRLLTCNGLDSQSGADDSAFRLQFVIAAEFARSERARIIERNKSTAAALIAQGRVRGATPFGTRATADNLFEADPVEAPVIRRVAARLLAGESINSLTRWLTAEGYRTRRGNAFTRQSLLSTLASENVRRVVLDPETVASLDARKTSDAPKRKGGRPPRLLSKGIATCGNCGSSMTVTQGAYSCNRRRHGGDCTAMIRINAAAFDVYIESEYMARYGALEAYERREVTHGAATAAEAAKRLSEANAALTADLSTENLAAAQEAKRAHDAAKAAVTTSVEWVETGETFGHVWQAGSVETQREALQAVLTGPIVVRAGIPGPARWKGPVIAERVDVPWDELAREFPTL